MRYFINSKITVMKTFYLSLVFFLAFANVSLAQNISDNAIGLRFGSSHGLGSEISYQRKLSKINRLEGNLGWSNSSDYNAYKITGIYQWVWNIEDNFNWYAGVGAGIENWNSKNNDSDSFLYASGNVGIEYEFDIPLLLSLDFRPEIGKNNYYNDTFNSNVALAIKYLF